MSYDYTEMYAVNTVRICFKLNEVSLNDLLNAVFFGKLSICLLLGHYSKKLFHALIASENVLTILSWVCMC
jgi:hypothetical protein